jgi:hypothetical protein
MISEKNIKWATPKNVKSLQEIMASPKPQQPVKQICIVDALRQIAQAKD